MKHLPFCLLFATAPLFAEKEPVRTAPPDANPLLPSPDAKPTAMPSTAGGASGSGFVLPSLDALGLTTIAPPPLIRVKAFRFEGNTIFTNDELQAVVRPFLEKGQLTAGDLEGARLALTEHYIAHDYVNSGALLPDQDVKDGVVVFKIVEGRISRVVWSGRGRLRESFLNRWIKNSVSGVLNMSPLRDDLQILQRDPNIGRIAAKVRPGLEPGDAWLDLQVQRAGGFYGGVEAHNRRPPSIGAEQIDVWLGHTNVTGYGDALEVRSGLFQRGWDEGDFSDGDDLMARYGIELPWWRTQVGLLWQSASYAVIEEPFAPLDVTGETQIAQASVSWHLKRSLEEEIIVGFAFDQRTSQTEVLGEPFSITPGSINGETEGTSVRFFQDYVQRSRKHVLAFHNQFSLGIDGTDDGTKRDASYFSWSLGGQWVRRLGDTDAQFLLRGAAQWSNDPLLAQEQLAIGGATTVRGYRENQLVRDWGGFLTAEVRLPLWRSKSGTSGVFLAPFIDAGGGWNLEENKGKVSTGDFDWIASAGAGVLLQLTKHCDAQVYWGYPLKERPASSQGDLQDDGIHFSLRFTFD